MLTNTLTVAKPTFCWKWIVSFSPNGAPEKGSSHYRKSHFNWCYCTEECVHGNDENLWCYCMLVLMQVLEGATINTYLCSMTWRRPIPSYKVTYSWCLSHTPKIWVYASLTLPQLVSEVLKKLSAPPEKRVRRGSRWTTVKSLARVNTQHALVVSKRKDWTLGMRFID